MDPRLVPYWQEGWWTLYKKLFIGRKYPQKIVFLCQRKMIKSKPSMKRLGHEQVLISPFLDSTLLVIFILFSLSPLFSEHWNSSVDGAANLQRCLEALPQGCLWIITNHSTNTAWHLAQTSWQWANRQTERRQVRDDLKKKIAEVSHSGSKFQTENKDQRFKETLENQWRGDGNVVLLHFLWLCTWQLRTLATFCSGFYREGPTSSQRSSKVRVLQQQSSQ